MKTYQSKKDETVKAIIEKEDDKTKTVILKYVSGPDIDKTVAITTSTLKRWWKAIDTASDVSASKFEDSINYEQVNTKYPEPKEKKYIPKPQSVIDYEEKKKSRYNNLLPTQDDMVARFSSILSKINKTYIVFKNGCWLERKSGYINLYSTTEVWELLVEKGFEARKNGMKNTKLPVVFKIESNEAYETIAEVLENA